MRIYLATPYSHPDPQVREARFRTVNKFAAQLMRLGHHVFSPISHCHPLALAGELPADWEFWKEYDRTFIEWAEVLYILCQDGWETSIGIQEERKLAILLKKPIVYWGGAVL